MSPALEPGSFEMATQPRGGRRSFCGRPAGAARWAQPSGQARASLPAHRGRSRQRLRLRQSPGAGWGSKGEMTRPVSSENGGRSVPRGDFHSRMFPSRCLWISASSLRNSVCFLFPSVLRERVATVTVFLSTAAVRPLLPWRLSLRFPQDLPAFAYAKPRKEARASYKTKRE